MPNSSEKQKSDSLVRVGKNIQRFRAVRDNMTQETLADAIGSNSTYISKIETGTANGLTLTMLEKLARALNVSMSELVDFDMNPPGEELSYNSKRLASYLYSLAKNDKRVAEKIFKLILKAMSE